MSDRAENRVLYGLIAFIFVCWAAALVAMYFFLWTNGPVIVQPGEPFRLSPGERMCVIVEAQGGYRLECLPQPAEGDDR